MEAASVSDLEEARARLAQEQQDALDRGEEFEVLASAEDLADGDEAFGQEEMFPLGSLDGDPKRTLKTLLGSRVRLGYEAKIAAIGIPMRDGLVDFDAETELIITVVPQKVEVVAKRDPESEKTQSAVVRQHFRPVHVSRADGLFTKEQVYDILTEVGVPRSSTKAQELLGDAPS